MTAPIAVPREPGWLPSGATAFVIVMENHSYGELVNNPRAPYLNGLIAQQALAANYTDDGHHPSFPNYIVLTSGNTWGIRDDRGPEAHRLAHDNLGAQLEAAGVPWRAYMESMGEPCRLQNTARYAVRHDPFVYYENFRADPALCAQRVVDYSQFAPDLAAGTYRFMWITPDLCDDSHDCTEQRGDDFLRRTIPTLMASPGYQRGGAIFITWDEGEHGSERIATVVVSPLIPRPGFRSNVRYGHASLLATLQDMLGLPRLPDTRAVAAMNDFFPRRDAGGE